MSRVENIEDQIKELSPEELHSFRTWFADFDARAWDEELERDIRSGKLNALAEKALRDHKSRRSL